jgi:hypothetical protein
VVQPQGNAAAGWPLLRWLSYLLVLTGLAFVLFSLAVYGLGEPYSRMGFVHSLQMRPPFADLRWVTANAECGVNLDAYYRGLIVGCDPSGRTYPYDYPPMTIWLSRFLHVKGSHSPLIGITTGISLVLSFLAILKSQLGFNWRWCLISAAVLMAFPILLTLERGNIDNIIYLLVLLFAFLVSRPLSSGLSLLVSRLLITFLAFLPVSLKIYPLFGIGGLLVHRDNQTVFPGRIQWHLASTKVLVLFGAAAALWPIFPYLKVIGKVTKEGGMNSHGLAALGYMNLRLIDAYGLEIARILINLLLITKILALIAGFLISLKSKLTPDRRVVHGCKTPSTQFMDICIMVMSSIWLGCYITTVSHDYRLIFIIPFLGYLASLSGSSMQPRFLKIWSGSLVVSLLIVFLFPWLGVGYTAIGMQSLDLIEPLTEFVLIPLIAGSVFYYLFSHSWIIAWFKPTTIAHPFGAFGR